MDKATAKKVKQLLDHYEYAGGQPEIKQKVISSLLGFMDGYVSAVLEERSDE